MSGMMKAPMNIPYYPDELPYPYAYSPIWEGAAVQHPEWVMATQHGLAFVQDLSGPEPKLVRPRDVLGVIYTGYEGEGALEQRSKDLAAAILTGVSYKKGSVFTQFAINSVHLDSELSGMEPMTLELDKAVLTTMPVITHRVGVSFVAQGKTGVAWFFITYSLYNRILRLTSRVLWDGPSLPVVLNDYLREALLEALPKHIELKPRVIFDLV